MAPKRTQSGFMTSLLPLLLLLAMARPSRGEEPPALTAPDLAFATDMMTVLGIDTASEQPACDYTGSGDFGGVTFTCDATGRIAEILLFAFEIASIPESISGLDKLVIFEGPVFGVTSSFTFPTASALAPLTSLLRLELTAGSTTIARMTRIPNTISVLTNLEVLLLFGHDFTESIPQWITVLTALTSLDLSYNAISGFIPDALCDLPMLMEVKLGSNALYGGLPACFSTPGRFTEVKLSDNFLSYDVLQGRCTPGEYGDNCFRTVDAECDTGFRPQRPDGDCAQFCGLTKDPLPSNEWFRQPCVLRSTTIVRPAGSEAFDLLATGFRRKKNRTCTRSAGVCGAANCKTAGGWCRNRKTTCCCMAGKDPVFNSANNIVGCTARVPLAAQRMAANTL